MSYTNTPTFIIKGLTSGKIETRKWYNSSIHHTNIPEFCRINGKLENYKIISGPFWNYKNLENIQYLAENIYQNTPNFQNTSEFDQISFDDWYYKRDLNKIWKTCKKYPSCMKNLKAILNNQYNLNIWQDWIDFGTTHQRMGWYIGMK